MCALAGGEVPSTEVGRCREVVGTILGVTRGQSSARETGGRGCRRGIALRSYVARAHADRVPDAVGCQLVGLARLTCAPTVAACAGCGNRVVALWREKPPASRRCASGDGEGWSDQERVDVSGAPNGKDVGRS